MSRDPRDVLRDAVDLTSRPGDGAAEAMRRGARLRWHRRLGAGVSATVVLAILAGAILASERYPGRPDDLGPIASPPAASQPTPTPKETLAVRTSEPRASERPQEAGAPRPARTPAPSAPAGASSTACHPPINDAEGDVHGVGGHAGTVDIIRTQMTFDPRTETLRFQHRMKDIVRAPDGRTTFFVTHFDWDGTRYNVHSAIRAGVDEFRIDRESQSPSRAAPLGEYALVTTPDGEIDEANDTVSVSFTLDAFNEGERALSTSEGRSPPAELRAGASLYLPNLWTMHQRTGAERGDDLRLGCRFALN